MKKEGRRAKKVDRAVEVWSLFCQLECHLEKLKSREPVIEAQKNLKVARMWLEQLEIDEWD